MALPFTEAFAPAAGVLANPPWTQAALVAQTLNYDGAGRGKASAINAATDVYAYDNSNTYAASHFGQVTAAGGLASGANYAEVLVAAAGSGGTFQGYAFYTDGASGAGHTEIAKWSGGVNTGVLLSIATTFTTGDVLRLELRAGGVLVAFKNGVQVGTVTDGTPLTGGAPGCGVFNLSTNTVLLDNFTGDNIAAAAGPIPRSIIRPSVVDRLARAMVLASALTVHTAVGRHELRGATQRTKVALPVVRQVRITPPPVRSRVLPYAWKGAVIKKPRPFPEVALIRKPLPVTRSTVLPHVLRGAAPRKPRLLPTIAVVRTPLAVARTIVGNQLVTTPLASTSIASAGPITHQVERPLPRIRSIVGTALPRAQATPPVRIARPVIASIRSQLASIRSVVTRAFSANRIAPAAHAVVAQTRTPLARVRSVVGLAIPRAPQTTPAPSRARPITAFVRTPLARTESIVGIARVAIIPPAPVTSKARPVVVTVRTPLPEVASFEGPQGKWFLASHERWAKPVVALIRSLKPLTRSIVGSQRPNIAPPASPRPFPRLALFRTPRPRTRSRVFAPLPNQTVPTDGKITLLRTAQLVDTTPVVRQLALPVTVTQLELTPTALLADTTPLAQALNTLPPPVNEPVPDPIITEK